MRARSLLLAAVAALAITTSACSSGTLPTLDGPSHIILGVYEPDDPGSYHQVSSFAQAIGKWPGIVSYYDNWGVPFQSAFASRVLSHSGETLVQIDPRGISLAAIAAGQGDKYLCTYASAVRNFGHQVIISFGQEMNGTWYSWGAGHTEPDTFIAAWRHIVSLFHAQRVRNVTWLWDVNCSFPNSSPISEWWPGSAYVSWVGVDCYYVHKDDTFSSLFGSTLDAARQITTDPILIAETAVGPIAGPIKIAGLFDGVRQNRLLGFVWFDQTQDDGKYHQDWRLEDSPALLDAFRRAVTQSGN